MLQIVISILNGYLYLERVEFKIYFLLNATRTARLFHAAGELFHAEKNKEIAASVGMRVSSKRCGLQQLYAEI